MSENTEPRHPRPRVMPPIGMLLALGAQWLLELSLPGQALLPAAYRRLSLVPVVVALAIFVWCVVLFKRHGTTIEPGRESSALIGDGPYRFSRNPIYLSMVLILIGSALRGSLIRWIPVAAFAYWIQNNVIRIEEGMLRERFGEAYIDYCGRVRRWI